MPDIHTLYVQLNIHHLKETMSFLLLKLHQKGHILLVYFKDSLKSCDKNEAVKKVFKHSLIGVNVPCTSKFKRSMQTNATKTYSCLFLFSAFGK